MFRTIMKYDSESSFQRRYDACDTFASTREGMHLAYAKNTRLQYAFLHQNR
jgi:hypothetical protein